MAKQILRELLSRFDLLTSLDSDKGTHSKSELMRILCMAYQKFHCSYKPKATGIVEQVNGNLKSKLVKVCASVSLKGPDVLHLVLINLKSIPIRRLVSHLMKLSWGQQ